MGLAQVRFKTLGILALLTHFACSGALASPPAAPEAPRRNRQSEVERRALIPGQQRATTSVELAGVRSAGWTEQALAQARKIGEVPPVEDLAILVRGAGVKEDTRVVSEVFLENLAISRLEGLFAHVKSVDVNDGGFITARRQIAETVLKSPSLASVHGEASMLRAESILLQGVDRAAAISAFQEVVEHASASRELQLKAASCAQALVEPKSEQDYAEALRIHELLDSKYPRFDVKWWISTSILGALQTQGVDAVAPRRMNNSAAPLVAAIRAAFEFADTQLQERLIASVGGDDQIPKGARNEVLYWVGVTYLSRSEYDQARKRFDLVCSSGDSDRWSALGCLRMAQTYFEQRQYPEAASYYLDARDSFSGFNDISKIADESYQALIKGKFIDDHGRETAIRLHRSRRQLAMGSTSQCRSEASK